MCGHDALKALAHRLRLTRVRDDLEQMIAHASGLKMTPRETLEYFLSKEVERRDANKIAMRIRSAHFPRVCTLAEFDFDAQPCIDPGQIRELATCAWIAGKRNLLINGPAGVGKTHLAVALGRRAIEAGYSVCYQDLTILGEELARIGAPALSDWRLRNMFRADLLVLDEMGYAEMPPMAGKLLFDLIRKRYEAKSTLIVTNTPLNGWSALIGNATMANTMLDRFMHYSEVLQINGESYRLQSHKRRLMEEKGILEGESSRPSNMLVNNQPGG